MFKHGRQRNPATDPGKLGLFSQTVGAVTGFGEGLTAPGLLLVRSSWIKNGHLFVALAARSSGKQRRCKQARIKPICSFVGLIPAWGRLRGEGYLRGIIGTGFPGRNFVIFGSEASLGVTISGEGGQSCFLSRGDEFRLEPA